MLYQYHDTFLQITQFTKGRLERIIVFLQEDNSLPAVDGTHAVTYGWSMDTPIQFPVSIAVLFHALPAMDSP